MSQNDWLVRLPAFQGPLDLLLFLVRRAEVDIHDIEIHTLTDRYLEYVRHISKVDIDLAGEFLVMAATLVEIKSRSLTPAAPTEYGDSGAATTPGEDPKAELIRQLLAYQKFRTAAEVLDARRRDFSLRAAARVRAGSIEATQTPDANAEDGSLIDGETSIIGATVGYLLLKTQRWQSSTVSLSFQFNACKPMTIARFGQFQPQCVWCCWKRALCDRPHQIHA